MVPRDQLWGEDLGHGLPRVVHFWVSFPLDQILELAFLPVMTVIYDSFHFEFFFPGFQVRWWSRVIGPMLLCFAIRGQQACVKYVMDGPGRRKGKSVRDGRNLLRDKEGAMMSGG